MNLATLPLAESTRLQALDATFRALPSRGAIAALQASAAGLGYSADALVKQYYRWLRGGMEAIADKRLTPGARNKMATADIVAEYVRLVECNQRKDAPAYRALKAELMAGGMRERDIPSQATLRNEARKIWVNEQAEKSLARSGMIAASAYLPQVLTTRVGLWAGSHFVIDDVWHDHFVRICRGEKQYSVVRPMELGILDLFSGCRFHWGCRPRLPKDDGTFDQLKEAETRFLLAGQLATIGYSPRGTTYMAEHGTAAIRERVIELLHNRSNGLIKVETSGIVGNEAIMAGMFAGAGKGNFKFKAALESLHNLIHNEAGFISAQAGKDRDSRPESTNSMLSYVTEITNLAIALKDDGVLELLAMPVLDWHSQWMPLLAKLHSRINNRTWHNLEGWAKCGHVVCEYLVPAEMAISLGVADDEIWIGPEAFLDLPGHVRSAVRVMAQADPFRHTRQARLSPQHVFSRGSAEFIKMPDHVIAEMLTLSGDLDPLYFRERPVKAGYLQLWDMTKDAGELRYESVVTDTEGRKRELPSGSEWMVCTNPFDLDRAWLFNAKGAFVGTLPRARRISRLDEQAGLEEMGHKAHRIAVVVDGFRDRHAAEASGLQDMRDHNARLLGTDAKAPRAPRRPKTPAAAGPESAGPSLAEIMAAKAARAAESIANS